MIRLFPQILEGIYKNNSGQIPLFGEGVFYKAVSIHTASGGGIIVE
jgi:hypothetical protein